MEGLADLHRHLDGSLRPATVAELADALGLTVPEELAFRPGIGLEEALARFAFTLSLLQTEDAIARVAAEICEDAAADGVTTLEIRFAPQLHGIGVAAAVDAALAGIAGRAGLILCGLYGEDPAVLGELVDVGGDRAGVVAIDIAGGPSTGDTWGLDAYVEPYAAAGERGLGRTVHAGEGRPPEEIRYAIEALGADRIGHGTTLLDDEDVVALVIDRGVTIEACPSSNVHTGIIDAVADHPLVHWLERGVEVCVNTDNTLLSQVSASEELDRVMAIPGMDAAKRDRLIAAGHRAAFQLTSAA